MTLFYRITGTLAGLSMLGWFLIIFTFLWVKSMRRHPTSLILFLGVSDFFFGLKFFVTAVYKHSITLQNKPGWCTMQAVVAQFFGLSSIGWMGMITINMIINLKNPFANTAKYAPFYHLWVWGYAGITTIIMLIFREGDIGPAGDGTCWIKQDETIGKTNLFVLTFLIPLVGYFILAIVALVYALIRARGSMEGQPKSQTQLMIRMICFVVSFAVIWIGPIFHRVMQIWVTDYADETSYRSYWDGISVSSEGLINCFIWLSHPLVFKSFRESLQRMGCCWQQAAEKVPLLKRFQAEIEEQEDFQRMDSLLRKNLITSVLIGIRKGILHPELESSERRGNRYTVLYSSSMSVSRSDLGLSQSTLSDLTKMKMKYMFKNFKADEFAKIREIDGISSQAYAKAMDPESFLASLKNQKFSDGRSGSFFVFSPCKNFILKTVEKSEAKVLKSIIPDFCDYVATHKKSFINRLYGFHSLKLQGMKIYVIVLGNVFNTPKKISEKYDLKFSWVARYVKEHAKDSSVLGKDLNLSRKLKLDPIKRQEFIKIVFNDVQFLSSHGIMDYSLLLGFHFSDKEAEHTDHSIIQIEPKAPEVINKSELNLENPGIVSSDGKETYFVGMIDILQAWNLNKKSERCFKIYFLRNDKEGLSAQPVDVYARRFMERLPTILEPDE